jgi:methylenetetrahydrofolate reductase (NADPH)
MKVIDKIRKAEELGDDHVKYSFEFFPPKTEAGLENLVLRIERMAALEPLFVDVTWGAGGSTAELTLDISATAQKYLGVEVLVHITCAQVTKEDVKLALKAAREAGIMNILALRGDPMKGEEKWDPKGELRHAIDLVRLIREEHGDYFGIAIAGHPEGHPESESKEEELRQLKAKVDAGADIIITQFFYDTSIFTSYVQSCRDAGIECPIIPGIMPIHSYTAFSRMTEFCGTKVPPSVLEALEPIKNDDEAVKDYGVRLGISMCQELVAAGFRCLHFYTLNLERSVRLILNGSGYASLAATRRQYPWRASTDLKRAGEDVRPIHWANCPRSYVTRTRVWDEFPNGRWGDGRSPAFGELSDTHFLRFKVGSKADRRAMWGEVLLSKEEVFAVFAKYIEGRIPKLPWCESPLQQESRVIRDRLIAVNAAGFMTINSQPAVNGAPSDHPTFGWGGAGGRVYQKAYVEFFCTPDHLDHVIVACAKRAHLDFFAVNADGETKNKGLRSTTALTWGVFPSREVQQPTIFDPDTFLVWRQEAFSLWLTLWAGLYDDESMSARVLHELHDTCYLVAIVNNDYVSPEELWEVFFEEALRENGGNNGGAPS